MLLSAKLTSESFRCLLPQINPLMAKETPEMHNAMMDHAHMICGIVAHVKDRCVIFSIWIHYPHKARALRACFESTCVFLHAALRKSL